MSYPIEDIEGIGPAYAEKLAAASIKNTEDLLSLCGAKSGRKQVAEQTGVSETHILKWANLADLMRVSGIGPQYSELLEAAGVDTVKELAQRNPANLAAALEKAKEEKKLTRAAPAASEVTRWVEAAKSMDPRLSY